MKEFIFSVMCAGVASGIIGLFFEDDKEIGKYVRLVLSLCIAASVIPGAVKTFSEMQLPEEIFDGKDALNIEEIRDSFEDQVIENARLELCSQLSDVIFSKTGIYPSGVDIEFIINEENDKIKVEVKKVTVVISENADKAALSEYVKELVGITPYIYTENALGGEQN